MRAMNRQAATAGYFPPPSLSLLRQLSIARARFDKDKHPMPIGSITAIRWAALPDVV